MIGFAYGLRKAGFTGKGQHAYLDKFWPPVEDLLFEATMKFFDMSCQSVTATHHSEGKYPLMLRTDIDAGLLYAYQSHREFAKDLEVQLPSDVVMDCLESTEVFLPFKTWQPRTRHENIGHR